MSYYTHFYPKKGLYNEKNLSIEEINREISQRRDSIERTKMLLKGEAVSAYYSETTRDAMSKLVYLFHSLEWDYEQINKYEWAITIDSDMKEYKSVAINHANCDSKYELQDRIDDTKKYVLGLLRNLIILTRVKFIPPKKDEDGYWRHDGEQTEMEYLMGEYQFKIDEILESLEEAMEEMSKNQFMLDCFDGHKGEAELEAEEKTLDTIGNVDVKNDENTYCEKEKATD